MDKKEIQEQRMRGYFIQATRELLKGEGLRSVSVRNIADRAGYSYATLYNYFKDVKDLIFECVREFQEECRLFVESETTEVPVGITRIRAILTGYIRYFVQYPGIFELFFLENISPISHKQPTIDLIYTFPDRLCAADWNFCIHGGMITGQEADIMKDQVRLVITGLLLFYLNRRRPADYREFMDLATRQLDRILDNVRPNREVHDNRPSCN